MHSTLVHGVRVFGVDVDDHTRCAHYHSDIDVIAIRFPCCNQFFPCYLCHDAVATHPAVKWSNSSFEEDAILCGACGHRLTIKDYLAGDSICPACHAQFNPGCKAHRYLYFE